MKSLRRTLESYPQWAGQLLWNTYDPSNASGHTHRHGRIAVKYGGGKAAGEPGVGFFVARHPGKLADLIPSVSERASGNAGMWAIDAQLPSHTLLSPELVTFQDNVSHLGLPAMSIQLTCFADGGYAVGVKMCHALADAATLVTFMHDWSSTNSAMASNGPLPTLEPVFDPALLDSLAAGDIDGPRPNLEIVQKVRGLPIHRYDWFASGTPNCPPFFRPFTQPPPELDISNDPEWVRGVPIPWEEWDLSVPVRHTIIYFSAEEIRAMHDKASQAGTVKLSKLDALLAHVWACVLRARELGPDEKAYLDMTFGFRTRLGLPEKFLGSPIRLTGVPALASSAQVNDIASLARQIRSTIGRFDKETCREILQDLAHEPTAQNIWATFLGRHHTLTTSWTNLGLYGVSFTDDGTAPRYVDATMPPSDGLLQVSEAAPRDGKVRTGEGDWARDGASVSLHLRVDVMEKLCADPLLRVYAKER